MYFCIYLGCLSRPSKPTSYVSGRYKIKVKAKLKGLRRYGSYNSLKARRRKLMKFAHYGRNPRPPIKENYHCSSSYK